MHNYEGSWGNYYIYDAATVVISKSSYNNDDVTTVRITRKLVIMRSQH
jgi:hypothetical protein